MPVHLLTMQLSNIQTTLLWLLLSLCALSQGKTLLANSSVPLEIIKNGSFSSPWLRKTGRGGGGGDPRGGDRCWNRPRICNRGETPPFRMRCCQNRCVDVSSDVNHCGSCDIRCPYTWACCRGRCRNINFNRFHCGGCFRRCPIRVRCLYGMCGYGEQTPSFPPRRPCPRQPCPPSPPFPPQRPCPRQPCPPSPPRQCPRQPCPPSPPRECPRKTCPPSSPPCGPLDPQQPQRPCPPKPPRVPHPLAD